MIAIESFKKFKLIDIYVFVILLGLFLFSNFLINWINHPIYSFVFSSLVLVIFMSLSLLIIRKAFSVIIFNFLVGIFSAILKTNFSNISLLSNYNFIILILIAIIYELIFLMLKLEFRNVPIDIIIGAAIANSFIPILLSLFFSLEVTKTMMFNFVNLFLLYFLIGISGSIIAFLIWYELENRKIILKYEFRH
ncbi:MAG: hypothetical protein PHD81_03240 [Candidatus Nanoarchaeia archaeon]|nr:hypothetical protein [Candidatus Nanoarchaeia archaeon]MDD5588099.1 hypothetical protein [Candidatus Nanoarchaeia archaeon]